MEQQKEIWKDIAGFENYQVSNFGRVKSKERVTRCNTGFGVRKERILKQSVQKNGYLAVKLYNGNNTKEMFSVHRLVAMAFLGVSADKEIDHKDGNAKNNKLTNLRWCCHKDNMNNLITKMRMSMLTGVNSRHKKSVVCYSVDGVKIGEYPTITEASKKTGAYRQNISKCCKGKMKMVSGLIFRYS